MDTKTIEPQRVIDSDTSRRRERTLIATLLDLRDGKLGPNMSTALAYCPEFWDDPDARQVGVAIKCCIKVGRPITLCSVSEYLAKQDRVLLHSKDFEDSVSPLIAEYEAFDLLLRYRGKRLSAVLGHWWQESRMHPEQAKEIAAAARRQLEEF